MAISPNGNCIAFSESVCTVLVTIPKTKYYIFYSTQLKIKMSYWNIFVIDFKLEFWDVFIYATNGDNFFGHN